MGMPYAYLDLFVYSIHYVYCLMFIKMFKFIVISDNRFIQPCLAGELYYHSIYNQNYNRGKLSTVIVVTTNLF